MKDSTKRLLIGLTLFVAVGCFVLVLVLAQLFPIFYQTTLTEFVLELFGLD